jgi:hypothetical protein
VTLSGDEAASTPPFLVARTSTLPQLTVFGEEEFTLASGAYRLDPRRPAHEPWAGGQARSDRQQTAATACSDARLLQPTS